MKVESKSPNGQLTIQYILIVFLVGLTCSIGGFMVGSFVAPARVSAVSEDTSLVLSRGQIAPLLVRVYSGATGKIPQKTDCPFTDIDSLPPEQHDAICQLWSLQVVVGTERNLLYTPQAPFAEFADVYLTRLSEAIVRDQ